MGSVDIDLFARSPRLPSPGETLLERQSAPCLEAKGEPSIRDAPHWRKGGSWRLRRCPRDRQCNRRRLGQVEDDSKIMITIIPGAILVWVQTIAGDRGRNPVGPAGQRCHHATALEDLVETILETNEQRVPTVRRVASGTGKTVVLTLSDAATIVAARGDVRCSGRDFASRRVGDVKERNVDADSELLVGCRRSRYRSRSQQSRPDTPSELCLLQGTVQSS